MEPRKPFLGFTVNSSLPKPDGHTGRYTQYHELHIGVYRIHPFGSSERVCSFKWQAGMLNDRPASEGFDEWYAGTMHVECDGYRLMETMKGASRIAKTLEHVAIRSAPLATIHALEASGIAFIVDDRVTSGYVRVADLTMAPLACWMDDYERTGARGCTFHVTAETAEEAQRLMLKEFGAHVTRDDGAGLRAWLDAGKPVRLLRQGHETRPDILSIIGATKEVQAWQEACKAVGVA